LKGAAAMIKVDDMFIEKGVDSSKLYRVVYIKADEISIRYYLQPINSTAIIEMGYGELRENFSPTSCSIDDIRSCFPYIKYVLMDSAEVVCNGDTYNLRQMYDINRAIYGGFVKNYSAVNQSPFSWLDDDVMVINSYITDSYITGHSCITDSAIYNSAICNGKVKRSDINDSKIKNSDIKNSRIIDSKLKGEVLERVVVKSNWNRRDL
jgi:hypothetical protein